MFNRDEFNLIYSASVTTMQCNMQVLPKNSVFNDRFKLKDSLESRKGSKSSSQYTW